MSGSTSWSPMQCLPKAALTPSSLLRLDTNDGEVELMRRDGMELRADSSEPMQIMMTSNSPSGSATAWKDRNSDLKVTLTTHRMVFVEQNDPKHARFLHLSNIHAISAAGYGTGTFKSLTKTPKILISTYNLGDLLVIFQSSASFSSKDRDEMLQALQKALDRRAWEEASRLDAKQKASTKVADRKVGVDAILAKNAMRHKEAAKLTDEAFEGDTETLLKEASELVRIIQKYGATLDSQDQSKAGDKEDKAKLSDMMQDMGMTSALTKSDHRGDYYTTLARQLADFLRHKLKQAGGLLTLTDVYCFFNRARGTNLISPEDLLQAVSCMKDLKLGMSLREFPSGLRVVQDESFNDETMAKKILVLAEHSKSECLTALDASRALHISALLANEQLLSAERMGYICRDVTLEGTRFFPNRFDEFKWNF
mmetsp:Transcript_5144/g.7529  ORF Transcript_5144/g.7529 Transcript_5144/m.7529 type:complete len:425 (+) Transcript_5144:203-1477(+)